MFIDMVAQLAYARLMEKNNISTTEAARLLGCSLRTVQRMVDKGVLPAWKLTPGLKSVYVVERKDVEALIKQRKAMAGKRNKLRA
jgi:excisionase family DNA binding protein